MKEIPVRKSVVEWVIRQAGPSPTGLALNVASVIDSVFGLNKLDTATLNSPNWGSDHHIAVPLFYTSLATFDDERLTKLVVLCHDRCLRLQISPGDQPRSLVLMFHQRERTGDIGQRMPTMEEHLESIRRYYPS